MSNLIDTAVDLHLVRSRRECLHHIAKLYEGIDCRDKTVLDIGCGNGIWGLAAKDCGAKRVVGIDPKCDVRLWSRLSDGLVDVSCDRVTFQDFRPEQFDIILFHNSIHHLNERACKNLMVDSEAEAQYFDLLAKVYECLKPGGTIIILDASNENLWCDLHFKTNPFVPSIRWVSHHPPKIWSGLLWRVGFAGPKLSWIGPAELPLDSWWGQYLLIGQFRLTMSKPQGGVRCQQRKDAVS